MKDNFLNKKLKYVYHDACSWIGAACIIIFVLTNVVNPRIYGVSLIYWLSLIPSFANHGCLWQFFTYMFVHGSPIHLLLNMYALFCFGRSFERAFGTYDFLLFYFICGVLGGVISYVIYLCTGLGNIAIMGASGAIYALLFIASVLNPRQRVLLFFVFPVKLPIATMIFIMVEIASQLTGSGASVAHLVHLSSIAVAWIYCILRFRISPWKVWKESI